MESKFDKKLFAGKDPLTIFRRWLAEARKTEINDPDAKSADLNVARQFLKDNNIDAVPVEDSPLRKLIEELPFDAKDKQVVKN